MHSKFRSAICTGKLRSWDEEAGEALLKHFRAHAAYIMECGLNYPEHEVCYEQSIVAPAVNILLQIYQITGEEEYLIEAKKHLNILELFNGAQPDYHLYETAIRHWDGYWFGKRKLYGDTFPHYWSALTGNVFLTYWEITGEDAYRKRAEDSVRGTLSLFGADGSASCAYVYPWEVNGKAGRYYDAWANDQDWAMYFALRCEEAVRGMDKQGNG